MPLPPLSVAIRSGDTPAADRQRLVRKPPDILITTPESLHLMLTSRARDTLRAVSHVIVDEIHALCPNKRGAFLALLLERLEAINPDGFARIGLSATQRPLEEVARFLGGLRKITARNGKPKFEPRPVTIVDAGQRKDLDLEVNLPGLGPGPMPPGSSIWPAVDRRLLELIQAHRSTIVFANNRRVVERLTARLNDLANEGLPEGEEPKVVRPFAPRQPEPRPAPGDRGSPEAGRFAGGRGDGLAGAGHRHGGGRPGLSGRVAGGDRTRLAARRPRGPRRRCPEPGGLDRQDGRRCPGIGRPGRGDARRRGRGPARARRPARCPGATGGCVRGRRSLGRPPRCSTSCAGRTRIRA